MSINYLGSYDCSSGELLNILLCHPKSWPADKGRGSGEEGFLAGKLYTQKPRQQTLHPELNPKMLS